MYSLLLSIAVMYTYSTCISANSLALHNASLADSMTRTHKSDVDPLSTLGTIALKMVEHIAKAEDEGVNMPALSDFVTALSKAAAVVKHPEIPQLETIDEKLTNVDKKVTEEIGNLHKSKKEMETSILDAKTSLGKLKQQLEEATNAVNVLQEKGQHRLVGFTASSISSQSFTSGTIVKFEKIHVNFGNDYDPSVSIFTCPVSGAYVVSVTCEESATKGLYLDAVMDGERIFHLYEQPGGNVHHNTVSSSVLVECKALSKIWVQATDNGQIYAPHVARNLFSIHLLQQL